MARGHEIIAAVIGNLVGITHTVRFIASDEGWFARCSCGWGSDALPRRADAEDAWDRHTSAIDLRRS